MAGERPIVIGHRGASGYRPEHTLASYELAARLGADFLEPDLVATADGVLVARHEPELGGDHRHRDAPRVRRPAAPPASSTGHRGPGWFVDDLTLAELRTLRAVERLPALRPANTRFDGAPGADPRRDPRPTGAAVRRARPPDRRLPRDQEPGYFADRGLPLEPALVDALRGAGLDRPGAPVFVQSFDPASLRQLRTALRVPLVQLVDDDAPHLVTPDGLADIAEYADAVGVHKNLVIPRTAAGTLGDPGPLVDDAHAAGLAVHAFTFRDENAFLPADLRRGWGDAERGDGVAECVAFLEAGVDGLFDRPPGHRRRRPRPDRPPRQTMRWSS